MTADEKEELKELQIEVKILHEIVGEMAKLLTVEQRNSINKAQNARHMSQQEYERAMRDTKKEPAGSLERGIRIGRLLK